MTFMRYEMGRKIILTGSECKHEVLYEMIDFRCGGKGRDGNNSST